MSTTNIIYVITLTMFQLQLEALFLIVISNFDIKTNVALGLDNLDNLRGIM